MAPIKWIETITLNIGLRKSLWDNRAVISLAGGRPFTQGQCTDLQRAMPTRTIPYMRAPETQFIRLGFTYNLGNYRLSKTERNIKKSELQRLDNE